MTHPPPRSSPSIVAPPAPDGSATEGRSADWKIAFWLGSLVAAVLLLLSSGGITGSDGPAMYQVTRSIVEHGSVTVPPALGFPGRGGHFYATHGLGLPLVSIVPYVLAWPIAHGFGHPNSILEAAVASVMPIVGGLLAAALYFLSRRLRARRGSSLLVAFGGVAGTFLLVYLKDFYSEPLGTLFMVLAIDATLAGWARRAGLAAGAAGITRPQLFAVAPILLWRTWSDRGYRAALGAAVPVLVAAVFALAYNVLRFGDPLQFDPLQGSIHPGGVGSGLEGLLFFPRKSILLFAPVAVIVPFALWELWRTNRSAVWLLGGNLLVVLLITAAWPAWDGGWSWGPRLLLPGIVPALAAIAPWIDRRNRARRLVVSALLALGLLVSIPAVIVSSRAQLISHPPSRGPDVIRQYGLVSPTAAFTVRHIHQQGPRPERYLDFWQVRAIRLADGGGAAAAVVVSGALVAAAAFAGLRLRRSFLAAPLEPSVEPGGSPRIHEHAEGRQDGEDREDDLVQEGALSDHPGQEERDGEQREEHPGEAEIGGTVHEQHRHQ
jgi:hypothetical protein